MNSKSPTWTLGTGDEASSPVPLSSTPATYGVVGAKGTVEDLGNHLRRWHFPDFEGILLHAPESDAFDAFVWPWPHARLTQLSLMDQTDRHNELLWQREWLLWPAQAPFSLTAPIIALENPLSGEGVAFVRLAPLPHARSANTTPHAPQNNIASGVEGTHPAIDTATTSSDSAPTPAVRPDFEVLPRQRTLRIFRTGYPIAELHYTGGATGRIRALHALQRKIRCYEPGRDGQFVSNTWGDRSRDACIHEDFLLREIEAGARLGIDVVEIDDGWETGKTANSTAVAAGKDTGAWDGYWAFNPHFWEPDPTRFPHGLRAIVDAATSRGLRLGLWFGPDSSHDAANWERDANRLLELYRDLKVAYIKIDSLKTHSTLALSRQRALFDRVLAESAGRIVIDLDVTAELRPGYFGLPDVGTLFVENRYTDWHNYWPHQTLRSFWMLAHAVDPIRLRMEVLNPLRNQDQYADDPLAPAAYHADTLFAITMAGSPLGWFEMSNLAPETIDEMAPLIRIWKHERTRFHSGDTLPIAAAPDGRAWTGFLTLDPPPSHGGYALLFRELNPNPSFSLDLSLLLPSCSQAHILAGRGSASLSNQSLQITIPSPLDFLWVRLDPTP